MSYQMFEPKARVCFQNRMATVFPAGPDKISLIFDEGHDTIVTKSSMLRALANHQLKLVENIGPAVNDSFILDEKKHGELIRKAAYINAAKRIQCHRSEKVLISVIRRVKNQIGDPDPPGWSTLYTWIVKHDGQGMDADPLQTQLPKERKQDKRVDENVEHLIEECIDDYFLQPNVRLIWPAYEQFKKRLKSVHPTDVKNPYKSTFYNRVNALCIIESTSKREGKMAAKAMRRTALDEMRANTILEQIQMDAVHLNIPLHDDEGNFLGYPVNHFGIDLNSRSIMGFSVEIDGESSAGVIECMQNVVRFKHHDEHPETKNPWIMYGKPLEISHDGGSAYTSQMVSGFMASLGIIGQVNEVGAPWKKAVIERFNRTLRNQFASQFRSYLGKRGDPKHIKDSHEKVSLKQYKCLLTQYIVDDYNQKSHTALLDRSPHNVWLEQTEIATPMEPAGLAYAMRFKGNWVQAVYDATSGIRINNVYYNSQELHQIYLSHQKPNQVNKIKFNVLYNPGNIYDITVMIGDKLLILPRYKSDFPVHIGMSLAEHKAKRKKRLKEAHDENKQQNSHVPIADIISEELSHAIVVVHQSKSSSPNMPIEATNNTMNAVNIALEQEMVVDQPYSDDESDSDEWVAEEPDNAFEHIMKLHINDKESKEHD